MANVFKIAKQLRKKHPNKSWQALVKEAGRKAKGTKKAAKKKSSKPRRRSTSPKKASTARSQTKRRVKQTASHLRSKLREQIKEQLGSALLRKDLARTKRDKKKHQKFVTKYRGELRKLS